MSYLKFLINSIDGSLSLKFSEDIDFCLNKYLNNKKFEKYLTTESINSILIFQLIKELHKISAIEFKEEIEIINEISFFTSEVNTTQKNICRALRNSIKNTLSILKNNYE